MITKEELYVGLQVKFDDGNREPEYGFVSSWNDKFVFCRFCRLERHALLYRTTLRTVANSEACSYADLEKWKFALDADIKFILGELRRDPEKYGWIEQETEGEQ